MSAQPRWEATDEADLLSLVAMGPLAPTTADEEWDHFVGALRLVARASGGMISQNAVRPLVDNDRVKPQRIGAFYSRASARDLIVADGWEISNDTHGKNSGKPVRRYRWIGESL